MAFLEAAGAGAYVSGIDGGSAAVRVISAVRRGPDAAAVTYRNVDERTLYHGDEGNPTGSGGGPSWSFDGDAGLLRLAFEAYRISYAHVFDPYLAVHTSAIEPLPHQISAVYQEMLPRLPLRYILADDPGAGKTIMTGLFIKELMIRGGLKRCLIVPPGNLTEQWQEELFRKFGLSFEILTNDRLEPAASGSVFQEKSLCIMGLDKLARNEDVQAKLKNTAWDLIVCDEAHKMSASVWGGEVKYTKRFQAGRLLSSITSHFLLLTATPHNGKKEDFRLFMSLIDPDRFGGTARSGSQTADVSDVMRRLVKEELLKFDGTPLFPERRAYTVSYGLSSQEAALYHAVSGYVREEFNRADRLEKDRRNAVGFALTVLQRRLASSPEAIYQSLKRRRERLEGRLAGMRTGCRGMEYASGYSGFDDDGLSPAELEDAEEKAADQATAARTASELEAEIAVLRKLERMADGVRQSGEDRKWSALSRLLQDHERMFGPGGEREKLIIFTEHRDSLRWLRDKITSLLGDEGAVAVIHGGLSRDERRRVEERFSRDKELRILIATDAAGEGINLQRAHLMVSYDLPWNPNRLEQRFGRIHRIGQTEVCRLWNLVSGETREGMVYGRLLEKLEQEREALNGKVFDVLGRLSFGDRPLRELLTGAVRCNSQEDMRRLFELVDRSLDREALKRLLDGQATKADTMDIRQVEAIREDMERAEARRLQPHFIEAFFLEAFRRVGGRVCRREKGRYEILSIPAAVRSWDAGSGMGAPVPDRCERICFDKAYCDMQGRPRASLIAPGHPLLEAVAGLMRERGAEALRRGAVFVDDHDFGVEARLLFCVEDAVRDGTVLPGGGRRIVSQKIHFIELKEDGSAAGAGGAPYLDYRAAGEEEQMAVRSFLESRKWLTEDMEGKAAGYAASEIIPAHVDEVRRRAAERADKIAKAVRERMTAEIQYWDFRAGELKEKEAAGKVNAKLNGDMAARRADELQERMEKRLAELEREKQAAPLPPVIAGGAAVIPRGLMDRLMGRPAAFGADAAARRRIELAAMKAVMEIERSLGFVPADVSAQNRGYDIESRIPAGLGDGDGTALRFIEVKGRARGAGSVTVTKNEILTALNEPEQFILAVVEVDGETARTVYLKKPFHKQPDFAATSVNYDIAELMSGGEIVFRND